MIAIFEDKNIKIDIPADVMIVYDAFKKYGKKLYVVGGAVRDAVMGKIPNDWDLATDAKPEETIAIANAEGIKHTEEVGERFGIVIINGHEVATFRKDKGKGRRPDSISYTDIKGDVERRDLTINALFYDIEKQKIVDMVGGIDDLRNNRIRSVGEPSLRFDEDPLRKLRAVRFVGRMKDSKLEEKTAQAIKANNDISMIKPDAIHKEFIKGITESVSTKQYLESAEEFGLLNQILPGFKLHKPFIDSNDPIIQLANLSQDMDPAIVEKMLMKLKYSSNQAYGVKFLLQIMNFTPDKIFDFHDNYIKRSKLSSEQLIEWGNLIGIDFSKFIKFQPSVSGKDAPHGLHGEEIGNWKRDAETKKYNAMFELLSSYNLPLFENFSINIENMWNDYIEFISGLDRKIISEIGELESRYWKNGVEAEMDRITNSVKTINDIELEKYSILSNMKDLIDGLDRWVIEQGDDILQYFKYGIIHKIKKHIKNWH